MNIAIFNNSKLEQKKSMLCSIIDNINISIIKFKGNKLKILTKSKSKYGYPLNCLITTSFSEANI